MPTEKRNSQFDSRSVDRLGPGNHKVPGAKGLYVRVTDKGGRSYGFRYTRAGKPHWLGLGSTEFMRLSDAKDAAAALRREIARGADPGAARQAERAQAKAEREKVATEAKHAARIFRTAMEDYIAAHEAGWRSAKHGAQWRATLSQHAATLLDLPVATITTEHVLTVLKPIWTSRTETASRVRGRIEAILDAEAVRGHRPANEPNPARWRGHLDSVLPAKSKIAPVDHQPAVAWKAMPGVLGALLAQSGTSGQATAFIALTAVRSAEARLATWAEVNLVEATWTIPAARMKAKKEHVVPLSGAAMAILRSMAERHGTDPTAYVFPGGRSCAPLSDVAVSKALHKAAGTNGVSVHGLRSSFRDWAAETGVEFHLAEMCLAHTLKDKVAAAYLRTDLRSPRRVVMENWAVFLASKA